MYLSGQLLIIETVDKFSGMEFNRTEILSLQNIRSVRKGAKSSFSGMSDFAFDAFKEMIVDDMMMFDDSLIGRNFAKKSVDVDNLLVITYSTTAQTVRTLKVYSLKSHQLLSAIR